MELSGTRLLRLVCVRWAAPDVHVLEFASPDAAPLPAWEPGAHVDLHLAPGLVRPYSLLGLPGCAGTWQVAVKRDPASRGGSVHVHERLRVGTQVTVGPVRNHFALHAGPEPAVLIAGGIGITPLVGMAEALAASGRRWVLHYAVRERAQAAFLERLQALGGTRVRLHVDAEHGGKPLDVAGLVRGADADAELYACGPAPMLQVFEEAARTHAPGRWHLERFGPVAAPASQAEAPAEGYTVTLARSARVLHVAPGRTLLQALREAGVAVTTSCEQGICGSCETRVLAGEPDHRDQLLSPQERQANTAMMVCCSGSRSRELVLDL